MIAPVQTPIMPRTMTPELAREILRADLGPDVDLLDDAEMAAIIELNYVLADAICDHAATEGQRA